nr:beta-ureidopropionase-like [Leptinotarsa decemlineata]
MSLEKEPNSVESILKRLNEKDFKQVWRILYGDGTEELKMSEKCLKLATRYKVELVSCKFRKIQDEQIRNTRMVKVGLFQQKLPVPLTNPIRRVKMAMYTLAMDAIKVAAKGGVNIFCLQQAWSKKGFSRFLMLSFQTEYGKIAVNICYGRHNPLNWIGFALNGAEIVFNPCAAIGDYNEPLWGIEARNAAIANGYFVCAINRVGTEIYEHEYEDEEGNKEFHKDSGHFFGSTYVAAPNGTRSPGLSRTKDGLLIAEFDLNMCRQIKDERGFDVTQRLQLYQELLSNITKTDFKPQIIKKR